MTAPSRHMTLTVLRGRYVILQFPPDAPVPAWAAPGEFSSITRTSQELSIVCLRENAPLAQLPAADWHAIKVHGPFQFDEIGVLASLATPLAAAEIGIFVVSTFDTDYLLIQSKDIRRAIAALKSAGHTVLENNSIPKSLKEHEE
jgi:hypothetical protein